MKFKELYRKPVATLIYIQNWRYSLDANNIETGFPTDIIPTNIP
jgi:hypothetical protein